jgi:hypothetical protein
MKSTTIFLFLIWKTRNRTHWKTNSFAKRNKDRSNTRDFLLQMAKKEGKKN